MKFNQNRGIAQLSVLIGLGIMAIALPLVSYLAGQNQDNRNRAAGFTTCDVCLLDASYTTCVQINQCPPLPTVIPTLVPTITVVPTVNACYVNPADSCDPTKTPFKGLTWTTISGQSACVAYPCERVDNCSMPNIGSWNSSWVVVNSTLCGPLPTATRAPTATPTLKPTCNGQCVGVTCNTLGMQGGTGTCATGLNCCLNYPTAVPTRVLPTATRVPTVVPTVQRTCTSVSNATECAYIPGCYWNGTGCTGGVIPTSTSTCTSAGVKRCMNGNAEICNRLSNGSLNWQGTYCAYGCSGGVCNPVPTTIPTTACIKTIGASCLSASCCSGSGLYCSSSRTCQPYVTSTPKPTAVPTAKPTSTLCTCAIDTGYKFNGPCGNLTGTSCITPVPATTCPFTCPLGKTCSTIGGGAYECLPVVPIIIPTSTVWGCICGPSNGYVYVGCTGGLSYQNGTKCGNRPEGAYCASSGQCAYNSCVGNKCAPPITGCHCGPGTNYEHMGSECSAEAKMFKCNVNTGGWCVSGQQCFQTAECKRFHCT
jgi:hypothetical protein